MSGWDPGPDPWERERRRALAEEGLGHLARFRRAAREYLDAEAAIGDLIESTGGAVPVVDRRTEAGAKARGWTAELVEAGRRWIDGMERTFEAVVDGQSSPSPEKRRLLEAAGVPPERLEPWPPTRSLRAEVSDAERLADAMEDVGP